MKEDMQEIQLIDVTQQEPETGKKHKGVPLLVIAGILVGVYLVGAAYFATHFYLNGTVFGVELFNQTVSSVEDAVRARVADYQLDIVTRSGNETLSAKEAGLEYVDNGVIERLMDEQSPFLWPSFLFEKGEGEDQSIEISYNEGLLRENLSKRAFFMEEHFTAPENAYVCYGDGQFEIMPEQDGTQIIEEKALHAVAKALASGEKNVDLDASECYVPAEVTSEDEALKAECEKKNALLGADLTFDFGDRTEVVNADVLQGWVVENGEGGYELSQEAVWNYVAELAQKYDTRGAERKFITHSGEEVTLTKGDYGWKMNQEETAERLYEAVQAGRSGEIEVEYDHTAKSRDTNDLGDIYVEVSIEDQEMWLYVNGECVVDTPIVTGNPNRGNATPAGGVWDIDYKQSPAVLGTIEKNGYSSPVTYWMPFNRNVGIHDADGWRSKYGGNIYKYSGSHGCVNTPRENAKIIYETVEEGTAVVVY